MRSNLAPLRRLLRAHERASLAVVGIGSPLNGDDGAGVLAARLLYAMQQGGRLPAAARPPVVAEPHVVTRPLLVVEGGQSPEAYTGPLRRFAPALVILIDAAELDAPPGRMRVFDWSAAEGLSASTHTLPPSVLAQFLASEIGCQVALVGIQPRSLAFDAGLSPEVRRAVHRLVNQIAKHL